MTREVWTEGEAYELFMGRWSERVAEVFLPWIDVAPRSSWLDVGCGTGRLTRGILRHTMPAVVVGIDSSEGFAGTARELSEDERVHFLVGEGRSLPMATSRVDAAVSGLVLNFVPDAERMVAELVRVVRSDGIVGWYVWDYAEGMEFLRHFWDGAIDLDSTAVKLDEGVRFPICQPDPLRRVAETVGLDAVRVRAIDVPTRFSDFDDFWTPFLGAQGPAPTYVAGLSRDRRHRLREHLRSRVPVNADGSIDLTARAWAVRGTVRSD